MSNPDRLPRGSKRPDDAVEPTDAILYGKMTEKQFQSRVENMFRTLGFKVYHTYRSTRSEPGFPDLIMVLGRLQIVAELKRDGEQPTDDQIEWLNAFSQIPGTWVFLWRPSDMTGIQDAAEIGYKLAYSERTVRNDVESWRRLAIRSISDAG